MFKKITRKGAFETNSSSTHSFSMNGGEVSVDFLQKHKGDLIVPLGEFGWGQETYTDYLMKLSYVLTDCLSGKSEDYQENSHFRRLERLLLSNTGITSLSVTGEGYVDHQSIGTGSAVMDMGDKDILDFIFSPNNELIIDSDG